MISIAATDPRIPQPAPTAMAMATVSATVVTETAVAASMPVRQSGNVMYFEVGVDSSGAPIETSVLIDANGNLQFFPERSAVQRKLMDLLGIPVP